MAGSLTSVQSHSLCKGRLGQVIIAEASGSGRETWHHSGYGCRRFSSLAGGAGITRVIQEGTVAASKRMTAWQNGGQIRWTAGRSAGKGAERGRRGEALPPASGLGFAAVLRPIGWRAQRSSGLRGLRTTGTRRNRLPLVIMEAGGGPAGTTTDNKAVENGVEDAKILPYCDITNKDEQKSLGEMEQEFLEALQMFLEVSMAYRDGRSVISDEEYDKLKIELKKQGSKVVLGGPRCSLRSRKVYSDLMVDYLRMTLLNLPAVLIALGIVFFLDDITGFEITYLLELPEPYSFLFTWLVVLPSTYVIARGLTDIVIKDAIILKGPCPECGHENISFFGTILTVAGNSGVNEVQCASCKADLLYDREMRQIEINENKKAAPPKKKGPC
ncbi:hypothetical protein CBR_g23735 [Chara braunii]|uniref:PGR5-like protein 1A, chloroplastic n=1 Tax=Chara braunii TaxID=69332 RepID=A0A388JVG6_CHABU|nr:hypothetical protein CBR_g23735 [Chara braunii]|eukprot:GBG61775.1 hypothetical protein CBR_g23735 [Chara braunii]